MPRTKEGRTRLLIAGVTATGLFALAATALVSPIDLSGGVLQRALILIGVTALAETLAIRVKHGHSGELLTLFELAVVADIVLLPPAVAAIVAVSGLAVSLILHRRPLVQFAYNVGQYALGVVPAVALYHAGGGDFETTAGVAALFAGMATFTAINLLTISAIIAFTQARSLRRVLSEESGLSLAMGLGNSAVGLVAVSLYLHRPALLPAVLAPAIALHLAFRGWVQQKELSGAMEEEKTKLERILEHSSEGIVLADADGTVILWSPSMERMTGVPAVEARGKALSYLLRGRGQYGEPLVVDVSEQDEPIDLEVVAAGGTVHWFRVQHGPGYDTDGMLSFDVVLVTDVTRQREVDRMKDDFISTVSHELRTPLTPIKGFASLLLRRGEDVPPERRREALQSIVERADHMGRLVEDLLLASRISAGERRMPEMKRQSVDLALTAEKVLRSLRMAHPHREFTVEGAGTMAFGDPIRIEQVIANLVSNAVKFSDDGTPVDVALEVCDGFAAIHVRDEGRGIAADRIPQIFEKFKRLEDPLRMETGGAGLGLFIVKELARAMGGAVSVESELGRGSTFTVTLPADAAIVPAHDENRRRGAEADRREANRREANEDWSGPAARAL